MPIRIDLTPQDYEDGVATLLAEKFEGHGIVERDARLTSRSGGRDRQIDILVRLPLADLEEGLMVVDCKRYGTRVDIKDVETFIGLVEDVGAPMGLLVTTQGFTRGAIRRARAVRGIRIQVVRVEELPGWEPPLITCEMCAEAVHPDSIPGMAWIGHDDDVSTENGDTVSVTLGYCDKCLALYVTCPRCDEVITITEWREDEWVECEGGCGVEWTLGRRLTKDDLVRPAHDRLMLRI